MKELRYTSVPPLGTCGLLQVKRNLSLLHGGGRGELSYLAPLGSENISAPYFKQCFFEGGGLLRGT